MTSGDQVVRTTLEIVHLRASGEPPSLLAAALREYGLVEHTIWEAL